MEPSIKIWCNSLDPWVHIHLDKNQKEKYDIFESRERILTKKPLGARQVLQMKCVAVILRLRGNY